MSDCIYGCEEFNHVYDIANELADGMKEYQEFAKVTEDYFEVRDRFIQTASLPKYLLQAIRFRKYIRSRFSSATE